jgi:CheY-like chemotaxis protein
MKRVLIIEDDPAIRESLAELLQEVGYGVSEARNGAEGLRQAAEERPDLILLDLMMPAMNGWEFRAAQREDASLVDIPVIVISAFSPSQSAEGLGEVAAHFSKPLDVMALLEAVRRSAALGA